MIDWILAERIAGYIAGTGDARAADGRPRRAGRRVRAARGRLHGAAAGHGRCRRPRASAAASGWPATSARCGRCSTRCSSAPASGLGPLRPAMQIGDRVRAQRPRSASSSATSPSACSASTSSCCSTRPPSDRPPRLLFVLPNLGQAVQAFGADEREFMTWVALHEVTHAVQFAGVPWLHGHLAGLVRELLQKRRAAHRHAAQAPAAQRRGGQAVRQRAAPRRPDLDRHQPGRAGDARPGAGGDGGDRGARRARDGRGRARICCPRCRSCGRRWTAGASRSRGSRGCVAQAAGSRAEAAPVRAGQALLRRDRAARRHRGAAHVFSRARGAADARAELERSVGLAGAYGLADGAAAQRSSA